MALPGAGSSPDRKKKRKKYKENSVTVTECYDTQLHYYIEYGFVFQILSFLIFIVLVNRATLV